MTAVAEEEGVHGRVELKHGTAVEVTLSRFAPLEPQAIVEAWGRLSDPPGRHGSVAIAIPLDDIPAVSGLLLRAHRLGQEIRRKAEVEAEDRKKGKR